MSVKRLFAMGCLLALFMVGVAGAHAAGPEPERAGAKPAGPTEAGQALPDMQGHGRVERFLGTPRLEDHLTYDTEMSEDFEGAWPSPGWRVVDTLDGQVQWGPRDCTAHEGEQSLWCAGGGTVGSTQSCTATYPPDYVTWAVYGPFSLVGYTEATFRFCFTGVCEGPLDDTCPYDFFFVGESTDGDDFWGGVTCGDATGGPDGNGYHCYERSLAPYLGEPEVWVGFRFESDSTQEYNGYFVDDVRITGQAGPTPTVTPTAKPSETPTVTPTTKPSLTPLHTPTCTKTPSDTPVPTPTSTPPLADEAEMRVSPNRQHLSPGWSTYVDIQVTNPTAIVGVEIDLWWNTTVLEAEDDDPATPGVQCTVGDLFWGSPYEVIENAIDNDAGTLAFAASLTAGSVLPQRDAALRLTLRAREPGLSPLYLVYSTTRLVMADGSRVPCRLVSGEIWVRGTTATPDPRGQLRGVVFHDLDGDGALTAGEPGIPGTTVLASSATAGEHTAVTRADGSYDFGYLPAASYTVVPVSSGDGYYMAGGPQAVDLAAGQEIVLDFPMVRGVLLPLILDLAYLDASPTPTPGVTPTMPCQWVTVMTEDWEKEFPEGLWYCEDLSSSDGGEFFWDGCDCKSHAGEKSAWPAAGGADALEPCVDDYVNDMYTWMTYGPFDLSNASAAEFSFWLWQETEAGYDYVAWGASDNDYNYTTIRQSGSHPDWAKKTYDLAHPDRNYCGESRVWIAVLLYSDVSNTDMGPFVDDFELRVCEDPACANSGEGSAMEREPLVTIYKRGADGRSGDE